MATTTTTTTDIPRSMSAATFPMGGGSIQIVDAPVPTPARGQVLVQIKVAGVNDMDVQSRGGGWAREVKKFRKAGPTLTGIEFAGIALTGSKHIKPGMRVIGYSPVLNGPRAHAHYAAVPVGSITELADDVSFQSAAALSVMGLTALEIVDDLARTKPTDRVMVLGAAGGLGAYTVQLAKARGAHVTAVASGINEDFVMAQGADAFRARESTPLLTRKDAFNLIVDVPAKYSFATTSHALAPGGQFVSSNPLGDLSGFARTALSYFGARRRARWLLMLSTTPEKLNRLLATAQAGNLRPVIDSTHSFANINEAFDRFETPGKQGRVLLQMPD